MLNVLNIVVQFEMKVLMVEDNDSTKGYVTESW